MVRVSEGSCDAGAEWKGRETLVTGVAWGVTHHHEAVERRVWQVRQQAMVELCLFAAASLSAVLVRSYACRKVIPLSLVTVFVRDMKEVSPTVSVKVLLPCIAVPCTGTT